MKNQALNNTNDSFTILCERTLAACGKEAFPPDAFSKSGDPWTELAIAWDKLLTNGSEGIFIDAVHRIMWGIPYGESLPQHEEIVQIVKEELLKDGAAFLAWDSFAACDDAILDLTAHMDPWAECDDDYRFSIEHHLYRESKTLWQIRYSKQKYAQDGLNHKDFYLSYEKAIMQIVPSAAFWTEDFWCNEFHILEELINLYGIDYRDDQTEYGRILLILMNSEEDPVKFTSDEAWCASTIPRLPLALAKVIWPYNTKEKIIQMFILAAEKAEALAANQEDFEEKKRRYIYPFGVFEFVTLRNSWLYALIYEWFSNDDSTDARTLDIKKKLFTIAMNA